MTEHKKQHFIPASYLKAWCDQDTPPGHNPYVWMFSKDGLSKKKKAPENVFHEKDTYTINQPDIGRSLILEKGLSELERLFTGLRKNILDPKKNIEIDNRFLLCVFISAMYSRTKAYREHYKEQCGKVLQKAESMKELEKTATLEQKRAFSLPKSKDAPTLSCDDVKEIYSNPLQNLMPVNIEALAPILFSFDLAVFCTNDDIGFITSDTPCVWFDAESYKRPPMYRAPDLAYPTIEITLPISPRQLALINRRGANGYIDVDLTVVDKLNQRTRCCTNEYFIVNKDIVKKCWL